MTRHIRGLSQRARLAEFVFSESGATNAKKAAQMGAILGASTLAGLLMSARTAEAACNLTPCGGGAECENDPFGPFCTLVHCGGLQDPCGFYCTWTQFDPQCWE